MLKIDRSLALGVRDQIRSEITRLIADGSLETGAPLPSCRVMAQELGVAVNSVLGAYSRLVDDSVVVSKPKSGYFVSPEQSQKRIPAPSSELRATTNIVDRITQRKLPSKGGLISRPTDWPNYKYPFVCNQIPLNRFPLPQWRECTRLAMNSRDVGTWTGDSQHRDSAEFLQEICTRILPRRGVIARPKNVLVTLGAQQAIYLVASLMQGNGRVVAMEDPGYPDARNLFERMFDEIRFIPTDEDGMVVDDRLAGCDLVYVTPNRQFPTTVSMSAARRKALLEMAETEDFLVIEDDYDGDMDFSEDVLAPLYSGSQNGRVIYTNSLSKSLAPGLRLGYLVGQDDLVNEARALRGMMIRHPPLILQRTAAIFLRFGYHNALCAQLHETFARRQSIAAAAIAELFPDFNVRNQKGSTIFLFNDKLGRNVGAITAKALEKSVVIEPITPCFSKENQGHDAFRIGVSAMQSSLIVPGLEQLRLAVDTV